MSNSLGRAKDLPKEIHSLFCGFQPYRGGDDVLWALNEVCVADNTKLSLQWEPESPSRSRCQRTGILLYARSSRVE